jgi:hypothetical protein
MPGSMSPPMYLKGDPDMNLKKVLKKYKLDDILRDVSRWLDSEPGSPGALKKHFIAAYHLSGVKDMDGFDVGVDYYDIDLKDPTTWGEGDPEFPIPSDDFFLALFKAIKADERRYNKRSSYEF